MVVVVGESVVVVGESVVVIVVVGIPREGIILFSCIYIFIFAFNVLLTAPFNNKGK